MTPIAIGTDVAGYRRRVVDQEIDEVFAGVAALSIEGPRAVGKTSTALGRAATVYRLGERATRDAVRADPERVAAGARPVLIDEHQLVPDVWDVIKEAVDRNPSPGQFLLTGSARSKNRPVHPGSGRIVPIRMRPMTLAERGITDPTVSLAELLRGGRPELRGSSSLGRREYATEILASGFPGFRGTGRALRAQIDGYVTRSIDRDIEELAQEEIRNPAALRRWVQAYAGATSATVSFEKIRDAATAGHDEKPAKTTVLRYIDILERLWLIEPVPAWIPTNNRLRQYAQLPKHQMADPAIAARLLGATVETLLEDDSTGLLVPRDGTLFGALFESMVALELRTYAQEAEASVSHYRDEKGRREVDFIVERADRRVVAVEVKLGRVITVDAVKHLVWLKEQLGDDLLDAVVISSGGEAYRRPDGIGVVPLGLLGA
jgi:predicted AAA+ superfamily ATPase